MGVDMCVSVAEFKFHFVALFFKYKVGKIFNLSGIKITGIFPAEKKIIRIFSGNLQNIQT